MSSDNKFGDEPSMAEILASVRRIVADDQLPSTSPKSKLAEDSIDELPNSADITSDAEPSNRSDILQRLLRKQADFAADVEHRPIPLSADPSSALGYQVNSPRKTELSEPLFAPNTGITATETNELEIPELEMPKLESDEIEILDLVNPIKPSAPKVSIENTETGDLQPVEPAIDLATEIQNWAEGSGNTLIRKLIREEIATVFKQSFKD